MSLLNLNSFHKQAIKATGQIQRRFQQTKTKPKLRQSYDVVPVFRKASEFSKKIALRDHIAQYTYGNIFMEAKNFSYQIGNELTKKYGERVMFLCPNDANYLITQWAIWMSGQVAVPLSCTHPHSALLYYANDCNSKLLISSPEYADLAHRVAKNTGTKLLVLDEKLKQNAIEKVPQNKSDLEAGLSADFYNRGNAMILYTSGTTGNPKGVVLTHKNLVTQCCALLDAWKWNTNDVILHTLPLHHVHGIINALYCPLYIGAKCVMLPKFDSTTVWSYLLGVNAPAGDRKITVFMAVPTIYSKLIEEYDKVFSGDSKMCEYIKTTLKNKIRLMVSGSAPLPVPVYNRWLDVSGHKLLERYGMTEIGMCLSQVYDSEREPGYVGVPLPGVSVQIGIKPEEFEGDYDILLECSSENGQIQFKMFGDREDGDPTGELLVKGDSVFKEYYNRPDATENEFTLDRYFKTGDTCQYSIDKKLFKILGRTNVDIIKTGGYKVSALEIETHLLAHPDILDCAVLGVKDEKWGEKVAAVVVLKEGKSLDLDALREFAKQKVAPYAAPTVMKLVKELPKNSMGKINKKELVKKAFGED